ncbi:acyltransferase family [Phytophthora cinnamomi]|uniref:acyltransferase family n=1 Tax=Phytophthora cinnamomi TaxID=4785 RepID=UPI00355A14FE|nr:acyltransferase family [Phytophthora cinnamomi]
MLNESKIRKLVNNEANFRQWVVVLLDYFVKRILRVYPLFALVACVLTWMSEESRTYYYNLAHYHIQEWSVWEILTFNKRYYLFWTMPIEITYYFLIPVFLSTLCYLNKIPQVKWSIIGRSM